jgi:hypothetical protein
MYLRELGVVKAAGNRTSKRKQLRTIDEEMRVALSTVSSRIYPLCSTKQAQISHRNNRKNMERLAY